MDVCRTISDKSLLEDSTNSIGSTSSSSDLIEDASSSSQETMSPHANGPLYELSELMAQLPIKRGLSKFYQGKSQSHTSLASVKSLEDLAKKGPIPHRSFKMKPCKSHAGLDGRSKSFRPNATISKKASRASFLSSFRRGGPFVGTVDLSYSCTK